MPANILLFDDDIEIRQFMADILRQAGYRVATPVDSYVAVEMAVERPFDLVVLTDQMPIIDGQGVLRELRENGIGIPILLVSKGLPEQAQQEYETLGVRTFIQKPFKVEHLLQKVQTLLSTNT